MMIVSGEITVLVETVKDDESWPAGTITDAGTSATLVSLDCRLTVALAVGAWASETVPVTGVPPTTAAGESVTVTAGFTNNVAEAVELANMAVMVADCWEVTPAVVTLIDAEEFPNERTTVAGTWTTLGLLLARFTVPPARPTGPLSDKVPVTLWPPWIDATPSERPVNCGVFTG